MGKSNVNVQDIFLNQIRRDCSLIDVEFVSGGRIKGSVKGFDDFTVIVDTKLGQQLLYKHSIAAIRTDS